MSTYYFDSLSQAVTAVNDGLTGSEVVLETTKAQVCYSNDQRCKVILLADVTESQPITVNKNLDLVLNNHNLTFTAGAQLNFGSGSDCRILGAGGSIVKVLEDATSGNALLINVLGNSLRIIGGTYLLNCATEGFALPLWVTEDCKLLELTGCTVKAINSNKAARCIQTAAANSIIKDSHLEADGGTNSECIASMGKVKLERSDLESQSSGGNAFALHVMQDSAVVDGCTLKANTTGTFAAYTVCINSGTMEIQNCSVYAKATEALCYGVCIQNGDVNINHCDIRSDAYNLTAHGIEAMAGIFTVSDSTITVTGHRGDNANSIGISNCPDATMTVRDTTILADSTNDNPYSGNNTRAIDNYGTAHLVNVTLFGNHSGMQNCDGAKLYISGGCFSGYCHGGIYFCHGVDGEAFVNDAILRGGYYPGIFDYTEIDARDIKQSCFYIGGGPDESNCNITVYMDGCTLDATECHNSLTLRGSSNEQNNTLYMSNCHLVDPNKWIRIDNETHRLYLGEGMDVDNLYMRNTYFNNPEEVDYVAAGVAVATGELYRRLP